jgi:hypothetical protein
MFNTMKSTLFAGMLLATACFAQAADTAYSALRVVGKREGQDVLNRVLELRGQRGMPEPQVWKVTLDEPRARGGVREVEVQKGKIIGERSPTSRSVGNPMNFNQLNLDSEGAFTVANQEAQKSRTPFERVDYTLKSGSNGGAPVWELELFDARAGRVGLVAIAADSGTVLHREFDRQRIAGNNDRDYLDDSRDLTTRRPSDQVERDYDRERTSSSGGLPGFLNRVGRHFEKRGRQLENFFTGK